MYFDHVGKRIIVKDRIGFRRIYFPWDVDFYAPETICDE